MKSTLTGLAVRGADPIPNALAPGLSLCVRPSPDQFSRSGSTCDECVARPEGRRRRDWRLRALRAKADARITVSIATIAIIIATIIIIISIVIISIIIATTIIISIVIIIIIIIIITTTTAITIITTIITLITTTIIITIIIIVTIIIAIIITTIVIIIIIVITVIIVASENRLLVRVTVPHSFPCSQDDRGCFHPSSVAELISGRV